MGSRSPQLILSQLLAGDTRFTGWTDYSDAKAFSVTQPKSVRDGSDRPQMVCEQELPRQLDVCPHGRFGIQGHGSARQ